MLARSFLSATIALAVSLLAVPLGAATFVTPGGMSAPLGRHAGFDSARHLPGMRSSRSRGPLAVSPSYSIHDFGAPSGYNLTAPSGFNNTGQIFGYAATYLESGTFADCFVWTGSAFRRLPLPPATIPGTQCKASAINDADSVTGEYEIVGSVNEQFLASSRAFAVIADRSGFKKAVIYYANATSVMVGVNASQTSVASADFNRDTASDIQADLYFTAFAGGDHLTQLQAPASEAWPLVHYLIPTYTSPCPFGGCAINDRNEVLGYDYLTSTGSEATVAIYTIGEPASLEHLPISDNVNYRSAYAFPIAFNNINQLLFFDENRSVPTVYNIDSGTRTVIPVSAPNCRFIDAQPLSMNNHGEVLGVQGNCASDAGYWTWDPVHGTADLSAQIPNSAYTIFPLGVNDNGQILVQLVGSSNVSHWGTLDPVTPPAAHPRNPTERK